MKSTESRLEPGILFLYIFREFCLREYRSGRLYLCGIHTVVIEHVYKPILGLDNVVPPIVELDVYENSS